MPGPIVAAKAGDRLGADLDRGHALVLLLVVAGAVALVWAGVRSSTGGVKVPAAVTEDLPAYDFDPPPAAPVLGPDQHIGGYTFTPHRYPRMCGGEISAVINHGHGTLRLPHMKDTDWIIRPPSEVTL